MVSKAHFMAIASDYFDAEINLTNQTVNGTQATQFEAGRIAKNLREMLLKAIDDSKNDLCIK